MIAGKSPQVAVEVLVDTSVWSLLLRRKPGDRAGFAQAQLRSLDALRDLVVEGLAWMPGPVRQELLSGIKLRSQFATLLQAVQAFETPALESADFEYAAECSNACRAVGVQGSPVDFLLTALALRYRLPVLTLDQDFFHFRRVLPLEMHAASSAGILSA